MPTIFSAPAARRWHGGPPPTYQPRFSAAEIAQARAWATSQALPHGEVQRARLALLLHERPDLRSPEAARRLGQSTNWVRQWRRRWATEGFTLQDAPRAGRRSPFSDWVRALVIAIACELPGQLDLPLSRHFGSSVWRMVLREGVVISLRTVQRILARHHLKPWRYVSWMHPRDPKFIEKARVILDLYAGFWRGKRLGPNDQIISADEKSRIKDMVPISERPAEVRDRAVPGHWEGDLLLGKHPTAVGTLVERTSRYVLLFALPSGYAAEQVRRALSQAIVTLPEQLRRSLTWDQGPEMAEHVRFTVDTGVTVYFCDSRSPWQRGSNENTNGLLRQYLPKGGDFRVFAQDQLNSIAAELNGRPRRTLAWTTPSASFGALLGTGRSIGS